MIQIEDHTRVIKRLNKNGSRCSIHMKWKISIRMNVLCKWDFSKLCVLDIKLYQHKKETYGCLTQCVYLSLNDKIKPNKLNKIDCIEIDDRSAKLVVK